MKRLFLILCLITICNISYADIASVGYVDGVVATKQDTITDIATIRSGAAAGATAVQPSSLSTVATSGSYSDLSNKPTIPNVPTTISSFTNDSGYITNSYHDSTKQDKLPDVPGNNGKYKLVYNSNSGQLGWEFEQFSLTCPSGTYDIGFSQCIDPGPKGTAYGYIDSNRSLKPDDYGLTEKGTWGVTLYTGDKITGIVSCNGTPGSTRGETTTEEFSQSSEGRYCWCKMTFPSASRWVFNTDYTEYTVSGGDVADYCASHCTSSCGYGVRNVSDFRSSFFSSVGQ